ncbi:MAG TPA: hypothetical protein EYQ14_08685 [Gammaproteobacteria bacterium]|nr:hypothetical protein [Gammaproteobacteria bacterium]
MGGDSEVSDRNMMRLAAGLGYRRYTELLEHVDLSNVTQIFGADDEQVGRLQPEESSFLEKRGATVREKPDGHRATIAAAIPDLKVILGLGD